jgi:TatD DNase family protein
MIIRFIDIHSHLNLLPLSENKEAVLAKMKEEGVATITVGTGLETSKAAVAIAEAHPDQCWATVGVHPTDVGSENPLLNKEGSHGEAGGGGSVWDEFLLLARHPKVVAIGETGLDYFRDQSAETKAKQAELFKKHIELAQKVGKPLMLHVRASKGSDDAYYDALEILDEYSLRQPSAEQTPSFRGGARRAGVFANFHFFSGSRACMEAIVAAGYTVSVDGPITFSHDYDEMIKAVPLESLMVETDAPFAAPAPYRGKTCEPWMVVEVAKKIAELKSMKEEAVFQQLLQNTQTFFGLDF